MVWIGWCLLQMSRLALTAGFISISSAGETGLLSSIRYCLKVLHHPLLDSRSLTCLVLIMYVHGWTTLNRKTSVTEMKTRSQELLDDNSIMNSIWIKTNNPIRNSTAHDKMLVCKPIMVALCLLCLVDSSKARSRYSELEFLCIKILLYLNDTI